MKNLFHFVSKQNKSILKTKKVGIPLIMFLLLISSLFLLWNSSHLHYIDSMIHPGSYRLEKIADNILTDSLSSDPLSLHFFFENKDTILPSGKNVAYKNTFPVYHAMDAVQTDEKEQITNKQNLLHSIDTDTLSSSQQLLYSLIEDYLQKQARTYDFPYMEEPLAPSSGVQVQIPLLMAEYPFRTPDDIRQYLDLLTSIPEYFGGITTYEQEKANQGRCLSDVAIDDLLDQLDTIMNPQELKTSSHFLQTSFLTRLNTLLASGGLSEQEKLNLLSQKDSYIAENDRILTTLVAPAYTTLGDQLLLLKGTQANDKGLANYKNGKEYYHYLLTMRTGSSDSIATYKEAIMKELQSNFTQLQTVRTALKKALGNDTDSLLTLNMFANTTTDLDPDFIASASAMLQDLTQSMQEDFPAISSDSLDEQNSEIQQISHCDIKKIDPALGLFCAPAFYCIPPIDNYEENAIYINPNNNTDFLTLYTTISHEGYPGHMYQTLYQRHYADANNYHPLIPILQANYTGYIEGWATYVEFLSFDYAGLYYENVNPNVNFDWNYNINANTDTNMNTNTHTIILNLCKLSCIQKKIQLCMLTLLDFAIHDDGVTFDEVVTMLSDFGISDTTTAKSIYTYIVREPATYPSYCIGYLTFKQLKEDAKKKWDDDYSEYRFHKYILDLGPGEFVYK